MTVPYEYRATSRRPLTLAGAALALGALALSLPAGASPAQWALTLAVLLVHVTSFRVTGCRICEGCLTIRCGRSSRRIPLGEIACAQLTGRGRRAACVLHLAGGEQLRLPPDCLPPPETLVARLAEHGVPVARA
jgi:hypothetical protein